MAKVVLNIPYGDFIVDAKHAAQLCEILQHAESYRERYNSGSGSTYHVYPIEGAQFGFRLINDEQYRLYKLAGKPSE